MRRHTPAELESLCRERGGVVRGVSLPATDGGPGAGPVRRSKYRNQRTEYNGRTYSSKAEAKRASELDLLVKAGEILGWCPQVKFFLPDPDTTYTVDFLVYEWSGVVAEDVKGRPTPKFVADCKRWRRYGPCPLRVIKGGKVAEVIEGKAATAAGGDS